MRNKWTLEKFLEKAKEIHEDKYDYSLVNFNKASDKVDIICPVHGTFKQSVQKHLKSQGCPICGKERSRKSRLLSLDEFINRATKVHNNKYDYDNVNYIRSNIKVSITCPIHGDFEQTPTCHLNGQGCPKCANIEKYTKEDFINKANTIHNFKYDYSRVEYINSDTKICIICPEHGEFWQIPHSHLKGIGCPICGQIKSAKSRSDKKQQEFLSLIDSTNIRLLGDYNKGETKIKVQCKECEHIWESTPHSIKSGHGCPKCAISKRSKQQTKTHVQFIEELKLINNNILIISEYTGSKNKINCECLICGNKFSILPGHLLHGVGCKQCAINKRRISKEEFISRANNKHNNKYDYSKINFVDMSTKIEIVCPIHGSFWQEPASHIIGNGCPRCKDSVGEKEIFRILNKYNVSFIPQYCLPLQNHNYLIDFVIEFENKQFFIEYNGLQHYKPIEFFGGNKSFLRQCKRDYEVQEYCKLNNIELLEISYELPFEEIEKTLIEHFNKWKISYFLEEMTEKSNL